MPTLFRFLTIIAVLVALVYGAMLALVFLVKPTPGEMVVPVSIEARTRAAGITRSASSRGARLTPASWHIAHWRL